MGDGRRVWVLCRRIAGTKLGPQRRKWLAGSADPPEMDAWLAHMAQLGKDGGMEATPLFKGSRTDPKFIEERVRGLSHHQGARRVQQARLQEVPSTLGTYHCGNRGAGSDTTSHCRLRRGGSDARDARDPCQSSRRLQGSLEQASHRTCSAQCPSMVFPARRLDHPTPERDSGQARRSPS